MATMSDIPSVIMSVAEKALHCEKFGPGCDWCYHARRGLPAVLDAIPDGWAKVDGRWVQLVQCGTDFNVSENTDDWPIYRTEP